MFYAYYMHIRNVCKSEIYACLKYMHIKNIYAYQKYMHVKNISMSEMYIS